MASLGEVLGAVMDFLGAGSAVEDIVEEAVNTAVVKSIGRSAYSEALDMCGNEGQLTIIYGIGGEGFVSAAEEAYDGGDAVGSLEAAASHPEAVRDILEATGEMINDEVSSLEGAEA